MLLRRVRTVFGQFSQLSRLRKPLFLLLIVREVVKLNNSTLCSAPDNRGLWIDHSRVPKERLANAFSVAILRGGNPTNASAIALVPLDYVFSTP